MLSWQARRPANMRRKIAKLQNNLNILIQKNNVRPWSMLYSDNKFHHTRKFKTYEDAKLKAAKVKLLIGGEIVIYKWDLNSLTWILYDDL